MIALVMLFGCAVGLSLAVVVDNLEPRKGQD